VVSVDSLSPINDRRSLLLLDSTQKLILLIVHKRVVYKSKDVGKCCLFILLVCMCFYSCTLSVSLDAVRYLICVYVLSNVIKLRQHMSTLPRSENRSYLKPKVETESLDNAQDSQVRLLSRFQV